MTREHAKKILTHLRNGKSDLMLMDALDMAISALSADGEYIKKEDAINSTYFAPTYYDPLNVLTEARDKIKELRTYSLLNSENKGEFEGMTNGEVMQSVYADSEICIDETWKTVTVYLGADEDYCEDEVRFDLDWWNAPYKAESEEV